MTNYQARLISYSIMTLCGAVLMGVAEVSDRPWVQFLFGIGGVSLFLSASNNVRTLDEELKKEYHPNK